MRLDATMPQTDKHTHTAVKIIILIYYNKIIFSLDTDTYITYLFYFLKKVFRKIQNYFRRGTNGICLTANLGKKQVFSVLGGENVPC